MPVLASQALLTRYLEEGGLVLALVGEDHMDTPVSVATGQLLLTPGGVAVEVAGAEDVAGAGLHPIDTRGGRTMNQIILRR